VRDYTSIRGSAGAQHEQDQSQEGKNNLDGMAIDFAGKVKQLYKLAFHQTPHLMDYLDFPKRFWNPGCHDPDRWIGILPFTVRHLFREIPIGTNNTSREALKVASKPGGKIRVFIEEKRTSAGIGSGWRDLQILS
jgi:hypothetical protein